jgi:hypothetical protein
MDRFLSPKKRKLSHTPEPIIEASASVKDSDEDESTEFKLAVISSLHPNVDQQTLLDLLLAHEGCLEEVSKSLKLTAEASTRKVPSATGYQSSLAKFTVLSAATKSSYKRAKPVSKRGQTLHLYSPEDIAAHTPCSIIHNFLGSQEANELLLELLDEATTFEKMTFKLFDNVVSSPHTACFYVKDRGEQERQKTEYIYNGDLLTVRIRPSRQIPLRITELVNSAILLTSNPFRTYVKLRLICVLYLQRSKKQ